MEVGGFRNRECVAQEDKVQTTLHYGVVGPNGPLRGCYMGIDSLDELSQSNMRLL